MPYHQNNTITPSAIDIYFPEEPYHKLLNYTVKYCEGKQNILLGCYKHRNDVSERLVKDIESEYDVIQVSVNRKSPISTIKTVFTLHDDLSRFGNGEYAEYDIDGEKKDFDDTVADEYDVRHTLFAKHCNLSSKTLTLLQKNGYVFDIPNYNNYDIKHYTAYLINPEKAN